MKVGVDLVDVEELAAMVTGGNGAFLRRAFTDSEIKYCENKLRGKYESYAGKLAAKEAFMKAMGTGWSKALQWKFIEVLNNEWGAPYFVLDESVQVMVKEMNVREVELSVSHTRDKAIAFVVIY